MPKEKMVRLFDIHTRVGETLERLVGDRNEDDGYFTLPLDRVVSELVHMLSRIADECVIDEAKQLTSKK